MKNDGFSVALALGKPILIPRVELKKTHFRFSWLFFGIWIMFFDLESLFGNIIKLTDILKKYRSEEKVKAPLSH